MNQELLTLIKKYNQAGPRYTSYPPVPFWKEPITEDKWKRGLSKAIADDPQSGISLYIHLPFCESLCTYCGCNTRITTNHNVEIPYIDAVLKEWELYRKSIPAGIIISEIHLGGGTPTFFSAANLYYLLSGILNDCKVAPEPEFSIEGHPNSTSAQQLKILYGLGFRRISFGIQDFDAKVQKAIHRFQTLERVKEVTELSRATGFESVNYDLIYGLPFQTKKTITETIEKVIRLGPDRIAYYGYAHVPWVKPGQRSYEDKDLPLPEERLEMYETGRQLLEEAGYVEIGMDHFSKKSDSLYKSLVNRKLNRNFMGYTTSTSTITLGLGVSSISEGGNLYVQNVKSVEEYYDLLSHEKLPLLKGHSVTHEQKITSKHIHDLMCHFETEFNGEEYELENIKNSLSELERDGLLSLQDKKIFVTDLGRRFVRNICMTIDPMLKIEEKKMFSQTV